ncbi:SusC/RagA family TonB-linked outer membrane protein [Persicitalea jodogahamensis]|uniref:SusC/RagA family TonB-linked outer membrane protein n=1 Tax=Persicitalea jodogahamensis TaxID=402147 RepID=A0A8J3G948_9BACT|nr:TonB-dependent receptor [Persicitalea jodogahamensis]GHB63745.1 SusC/RagA family TonB-linked outer membrane protein [Persicitalea jodogahamensis]
MLLPLLLFVLLGEAFAQEVLVTGKVTSEAGEIVPGATVVVQGTSRGTTSNAEGNYSISAPGNGTLVVSFVGYETTGIPINGRSKLDIVLKEGAIELEQVVAVGYGTQRKKEVTGAVGQVTNEVLVKSSTADLGTALQGQIAGVSVQASSGAPGATANIQIRGINSVTGANEPLYVVDGIPYSGDPRLSMSEIETIDVLKDAASASIYGTRGSGGVILITTKQGKAGAMKVSLDGYYGIQKITSGVPRSDFEGQMYSNFLYTNNINGTHLGNTWTPLETNRWGFTNNTDINDVIQQDNAPIQNYALNISGGKQDLSYSINANYFGQKGAIINSGYDRFNVRANTSYVRNKWTFRTSIGLRLEDQQYEPWGMLLEVYRYKPFQQMIDPNVGTIQDAGNNGSNEAINLGTLTARVKQTDRRKGGHFNGSLQAQYQLTNNIKLLSRFAATNTYNTRVRVNPLFVTYDNEGIRLPEVVRSGVYNSSDQAPTFVWENTITYSKRFGEHKVDLLGVYSMEKYSYSSFYAQKYGLVSNDITVLNGATLDPSAGSGSGWGQDRTNSLIGMLVRAQYDYKGKYLLSLSTRRDGSSRFSQKYRWGMFPSVSAGWNVSDENFWGSLPAAFSTFKIRGSYGTTGNQNFLDYSNAATITLAKDYVFGREGEDILALGATQTSFANKNVKWETTTQANLGFDLALFNNKLTFTGDVYNTQKRDMLFPLLVPPAAGGGNGATVILNVGDMNNKGIEFSSTYRHSGDLSWSASGTFYKNVNTITKMSGSNKVAYMAGGTVVNGVPNPDRVTVIKEGLIAGAFLVMPTNGIIKSAEELAEYKKLVPTAKIGDLRYIDALTVDTDGDGIPDKGDGLLNDDDRVFGGSGTPDFELGFNLNMDYKGFDLSMQWFGSFGAEVINGSKIYSYYYGTHRDLEYQYTAKNPNSDIPAYRGGGHANNRGWSDYWIEDATFVRLRNISLGYTIPTAVTKRAGISKLRVYAAAQNPITLTKYTGFDPEVGNDGLQTRGLDKGSYPISSQYRLGLQFDF